MGEQLLHHETDALERRLLRWMMALTVPVTAALTVFAGVREGAGFALGAAIAMVGFHWLAGAVRAALDAASLGHAKRIWVTFLLRYPLALGIVLLVYETHWLPLIAVLAGMFVPVGGAILESLFQLGAWAKQS